MNKEDKINEIKRITLIETEFKALKVKEEEARREDELRLEKERLEAIKKKEQARKTRERKREDERRRTQEIILPPNHTFGKETIKTESEAPIPRFNTRRSIRQQSNRWKYDPSNMPPVMIEGFLDRKQLSSSGGKKSTIRSWKTYYTVLSGQLLCFFKDQNAFKESNAASQPILIQNALCEKPTDYTKKKNVFRMVTTDGSEYLFQATNRESQEDWLDKLVLTSQMEPSESVKKSSLARPSMAPPEPPKNDMQPIPEPLYANVGGHDQNNHHHGGVDNDNDTSFSSSEVDNKENKRSIRKFLGLKHKISTS